MASPLRPRMLSPRKSGVDVAQLEKVSNPKGEYLAATVTKKGRAASEILAELLPKEIASIYWPKSMYWREAERALRPSGALDGRAARRRGRSAGVRRHSRREQSRGHRILADEAVAIPKPAAHYVDALRVSEGSAAAAEREQQIRKALDAATRTVPGARWREDKSLLDTVVNLTEFPSVILGSFDPEFLALPEEVLVTVMRDHQKYFALEDADGKLLPHFLAVLNTDGDPRRH